MLTKAKNTIAGVFQTAGRGKNWHDCMTFQKKSIFLNIFLANFSASIRVTLTRQGGVAEWLKAAVLKTVFVKANVGSNPTSSVKP